MTTPLQELQALRRNQIVLIGLVLLIVAALAWTTVTLINSGNRSKVPSEVIALAKPLVPTLDTSVFDRLEKKLTYSEAELSNFDIYKIVLNKTTNEEVVVPITLTEAQFEALSAETTPTPTPTPTPPTPTATASGSISSESASQTQDSESSPSSSITPIVEGSGDEL